MAIHIVTEAERCLNCKRPMCQEGCPVHTHIPQIIQMFKQGKVMEAGEILFQNNPMSAICSIVCNHEQQCAGHCIRGKKDTPIHFSSIENYISDMYLDRMEIQRPEPKDKKVAVIGAGPAGLTVAIRLAQQGYPVTVFEWEDKIGGIMQYGIPEFRLPKSVLDRLQKRMEEMGITIRLNTTIGAVLMVDNLFRDGYSCVFVGTGADRPKSLGIEGESLLLLLDAAGICASSGSACTSGSLDPSHVLLALGRPREIANSALRLTLSDYNTEEETDIIIKEVTAAVECLRGRSSSWKAKLQGTEKFILP